jgi:hypothetical protein
MTPVDLQAYPEKRVNADGPSIPSTGSPSLADPQSSSAEPPGLTNGDGNFEAFKSRWIQCCAADFAALPAATQTRFVTEVLNVPVPSGDPSPPSVPFSVQAASMMLRW